METRVQKYKVYRASMITDQADQFKGEERIKTTTLPLNEVMSSLEDQKKLEEESRKKKNKSILILVLISIGVITVIVALLILGIYAFGGK